MDDIALLRAWRDGDRAAGSALLDRHFEPLYRFFANKVDRDVDDLIQRVFLEIVEARDRFREEASFRTFLFAVARLQLLQYFRRRTKNAREEPVDLGTMSAVDLGSSPSSNVAQREEEAILLRALRGIPVDLQIVIEMVYWEGASMEDLAQLFEIPLGTAKSRLRRAREALSAAMRREAQNPAVLQSTFDGFEHWVGSIRESFRRRSQGEDGTQAAMQRRVGPERRTGFPLRRHDP